MPYPRFDPSQLQLRPLRQRKHDLDLSAIMALDADVEEYDEPDLRKLAGRIIDAHDTGGEVLLMMGAHVIRQGNSRFIIDLMKRGLITHIAGNGACAIHDYEFALIGATTESVARYIRTGQFGLWEETGGINEAVNDGVQEDMGYGEAVGRAIAEGDFAHKDISILANACELGVPVTIHVGIGSDIIHEHSNFDGGAAGRASYRDFLTITDTITRLEGGVMLNFGTAVTGPEVYLKALAMARNAAAQRGEEITEFTTAVFDLVDLPDDYHSQPPKVNPHYYFRPWKTILVRTVQDGGDSFYFRGDHAVTFPNLYHLILRQLEVRQ